MGQGLMMVKNQHLLTGLLVLGAVNLVAFFALVFGERDSARGLKSVEREVIGLRDDQHSSAEAAGARAEVLGRQLEEARSTIGELQESVDKLKKQLAKTRDALDAIKERLDKAALEPKGDREAGR
jgi:TolA-binding protein